MSQSFEKSGIRGFHEEAGGFGRLAQGLDQKLLRKARRMRRTLLMDHIQMEKPTPSSLSSPDKFLSAFIGDVIRNPSTNRFIDVDGEAGIGKSQLIDEMSTKLAENAELKEFMQLNHLGLFIGNAPWGDAYLMHDPTGGIVPPGEVPSDFFRQKAKLAAKDYIATLADYLGEPHPGTIFVLFSDTIDGSAVTVEGHSYSGKDRAYTEKRNFITGKGPYKKIRQHYQPWRIGLTGSEAVVVHNFKDRQLAFSAKAGPERDQILLERGKCLYYPEQVGAEYIPFQAESASPVNIIDLRNDTNQSIRGLYMDGLVKLPVPSLEDLNEVLIDQVRIDYPIVQRDLGFGAGMSTEFIRQKIIAILNNFMAQDLGFESFRTAFYTNNVPFERGMDVSRDEQSVHRIFLDSYRERFVAAGLVQRLV